MAFCAISSAPGEGGVGIVRMSGENSFSIGRKVFKGKVPDDFDRKMLYGYIEDEGVLIDEVLIVFMKAPKTYTRLDTVEIFTHGGFVATRRVLHTLIKNGARAAQPGEFTKEAFLNGRLDLSEAKAVSDLIKAKTDRAYQAYLSKLEGSVSSEIKKLVKLSVDMLANIEAAVDYPEEDLQLMEEETLKERLKLALDKTNDLIFRAKNGKILQEGISAVILGKPNVGKSSILNSMLGTERAIVSNIPGTTRDTLEEFIQADGVLIKLIDTAGIHEAEDEVEKIGVKRAVKKAEQADLIIAVFDISRVFDEEDEKILELIKNHKSIVIWNKTDLGADFPDEVKEKFSGLFVLRTSFKNPYEAKKLFKAISSQVLASLSSEQTEVMMDERELSLLERANEDFGHALSDIMRGISSDILTVDLEDARRSLLEITGELAGEEVIDKIFEDFCLGK